MAGVELAGHFIGRHLVDFVESRKGMLLFMQSTKDVIQFEKIMLQIFRQCETSPGGQVKEKLQNFVREMRMPSVKDFDSWCESPVRIQTKTDVSLLALGLGEPEASSSVTRGRERLVVVVVIFIVVERDFI
jgi:hypothetical protein